MDQNNVEIVKNVEDKNIVRIKAIRFKGKRNIDWKDVEGYLKDHNGKKYIIASTGDEINVGSDFPDEYTGSRYTKKLMGALAKAKANAAQAIKALVETADNKRFRENSDERHARNANNGWYRYDTRFEIPVIKEDGSVERYNAYKATVLVRCDNKNRLYLYDILDIKKETSNSLS